MAKKSVLVIEDDAGNQFLMKLMLEKSDSEIQISQAYDGREALELLESGNDLPDLILLDLNMAGMDGFEFLQKLDQHAQTIKIPDVCVITSSNNDLDKEKIKAYDCVKGYLIKPVSQEDIDGLLAGT